MFTNFLYEETSREEKLGRNTGRWEGILLYNCLQIYHVNVWIGLTWVRTRSCGGPLWTR